MEVIKKRHYYIDLFRGITFFLMVIYHLVYHIAWIFYGYWRKLFPNNHYLNIIASSIKYFDSLTYTKYFRLIFIASIFLFISGVSSHLSKNIFKRGLKLLIVSIILSIITIIISLVIQNRIIIIYFGILHCISICMLLTPVFKKVNKYVLLVLALIIIGIGIYFNMDLRNRIYINTNLLIPFYITKYGFTSGDYYPLVPFLGVYVLGFIFGDYYFNVKGKPKGTLIYKNNIFTYFGKNTLIWYFLHQLILIALLSVFTLINLLFK